MDDHCDLRVFLVGLLVDGGQKHPSRMGVVVMNDEVWFRGTICQR
jgi:hypothetical protein